MSRLKSLLPLASSSTTGGHCVVALAMILLSFAPNGCGSKPQAPTPAPTASTSHSPAQDSAAAIAGGAKLLRTINAPRPVSRLVVSPDGKRLLAVEQQGAFRAWDLEAG